MMNNLLLIPFSNTEAVALPKNLVEYVLPYARPFSLTHQNKAVIGYLIYNNRKVSIIDLVQLHNPDEKTQLPDIIDSKYRIIILRCITPSRIFENYAVLSTSTPRVFEMTKDNMKEIDEEVAPIFYSKIQLSNGISNQLTYIPYLEKIESILFQDS
ncbi:MAG: hypothetical protein ACWIPH_01875 [Ostreibacterium sp.]